MGGRTHREEGGGPPVFTAVSSSVPRGTARARCTLVVLVLEEPDEGMGSCSHWQSKVETPRNQGARFLGA